MSLPIRFTVDKASFAYYLACWNIPIANSSVTPNNAVYNITVAQTQLNNNGTPFILPIEAISGLNELGGAFPSQVIGFAIFAVFFGLSLPTSFLSLRHLFKKKRRTAAHRIVLGFTMFLSIFNVVVFLVRTAATAVGLKNATICPLGVSGSPPPAFEIAPTSYYWDGSYPTVIPFTRGFSVAAIPVFLWVSEAFLLYRAWVIWIYHRRYITFPALGFLGSFVVGIYWFAQAARNTPLAHTRTGRLIVLHDWTQTLTSTCVLDALITSMIAGRLIYHHKRHRNLTENESSFYLPVLAIFIESAALSLIAKILQLSQIPGISGLNPIVVPLVTISSNLIVLRKAFGADIDSDLANSRDNVLSLPRFHRRGGMSTSENLTETGMTSRFIRTIGGRIVNLGSFAHAGTVVPGKVLEAAQEAEDRRLSSAGEPSEGTSPLSIRTLGRGTDGLCSFAHADILMPGMDLGAAQDSEPEGGHLSAAEDPPEGMSTRLILALGEQVDHLGSFAHNADTLVPARRILETGPEDGERQQVLSKPRFRDPEPHSTNPDEGTVPGGSS